MRCINASYAPGGLRVRPKLNPLSLNCFPNSTHYVHPARHFCRCSSPTTFAQRGKHMESPSGNTINDIHDHPEAKQLGVKSRDWTDFYAGPPQTDKISMVVHHTHQCAE